MIILEVYILLYIFVFIFFFSGMGSFLFIINKFFSWFNILIYINIICVFLYIISDLIGKLVYFGNFLE